MTKPVFLITLGAIAGALIGVIEGAGESGHEFAAKVLDTAASAVAPFASPSRPAAPAAVDSDPNAHKVFSVCLRKSGGTMEGALRDLLEFHEHEATVSLVECLLGGAPSRFCTPDGRRQAADAMEIYLWSREDARRTSPAHGLADKIRVLDRVRAGGPGENADPFVLTWSGPRDLALYDRLKILVKQGYLEPGAFAYSGRPELREAVRDVKPEDNPCDRVATSE